MQLKANRAGVLTLLSLVLICLSSQVAANVIGFDFGSTFFKITLVQPGNPFTIVENTTSKRKTDSQFTITKDVRLFGADSFIGTSRNPKTTFADTASFLGMEYDSDSIERMQSERFILNDFAEDERGLVAFQTFSVDKKELKEDSDAKVTYFSEELVAQILAYGKGLAEAQAKGKVKDAVITVPSHYNQEKRLMLIDAAELAGLNVIQLVHENSAAAVMYGIDRLDTEKDLNVLIYNMGGLDTEVSVVRYSAVTDSKNKTYEHVEIIGEGVDGSLGGKAFDDVLVQILAKKFNSLKERQGKADIRENGRVMKRLYKEANSIKDILSANKMVNVKIPELHDYVTLAFELYRDDYEAECDHLFQRVKGPINAALEQSQLTADQIDQIEILGGGIRVPKVQAILKETMNDMELHVHLNGDEAMSFGSAFIASNSSASYKVRKVYLTQHPRNDIKIKITPLTMDGEEADLENSESELDYTKDVVLYSRTDYLGQRKTIHLEYDMNMRITAANVNDDGTEEDIASFEITDISRILLKEVFKNGNTTTPKISLSFELNRSNLFQLSAAKLSTSETTHELIEKPKPVKKGKKDKKEENDEDFDEDESSTSDKDEATSAEIDDAQADEEATPEEGEPEAEAEVQEEEPEYKEVVTPLEFPLEKINETRIGARQLSKA